MMIQFMISVLLFICDKILNMLWNKFFKHNIVDSERLKDRLGGNYLCKKTGIPLKNSPDPDKWYQ
jgi:hypothetical protein